MKTYATKCFISAKYSRIYLRYRFRNNHIFSKLFISVFLFIIKLFGIWHWRLVGILKIYFTPILKCSVIINRFKITTYKRLIYKFRYTCRDMNAFKRSTTIKSSPHFIYLRCSFKNDFFKIFTVCKNPLIILKSSYRIGNRNLFQTTNS